MKRVITLLLLLLMIASLLFGCAKTWTCDWCGKTWFGDAYYGSELEDTLCDSCAHEYWDPLPYKNYKK